MSRQFKFLRFSHEAAAVHRVSLLVGPNLKRRDDTLTVFLQNKDKVTHRIQSQMQQHLQGKKINVPATTGEALVVDAATGTATSRFNGIAASTVIKLMTAKPVND